MSSTKIALHCKPFQIQQKPSHAIFTWINLASNNMDKPCVIHSKNKSILYISSADLTQGITYTFGIYGVLISTHTLELSVIKVDSFLSSLWRVFESVQQHLNLVLIQLATFHQDVRLIHYYHVCYTLFVIQFFEKS